MNEFVDILCLIAPIVGGALGIALIALAVIGIPLGIFCWLCQSFASFGYEDDDEDD